MTEYAMFVCVCVCAQRNDGPEKWQNKENFVALAKSIEIFASLSAVRIATILPPPPLPASTLI